MTDSYGPAGYSAPGYVPPGPGYEAPAGAYGGVPYGMPSPGAVPGGPAWGPPGQGLMPAPGAPGRASAFPAGPYRPVLIATAAAGVLVIGAAVAAAVAGSIIATQADDVGREIGAELGRAQLEQMDQLMDPFGTDPYSGSGVYGSVGPVEQSSPVAPGELGPDPVLDAYAEECFAGDLQACDDLYFESSPLSAYEEYGATCGGRVKIFTVPYCTELD